VAITLANSNGFRIAWTGAKTAQVVSRGRGARHHHRRNVRHAGLAARRSERFDPIDQRQDQGEYQVVRNLPVQQEQRVGTVCSDTYTEAGIRKRGS
jgi:hypothetical protein